MQLTDPITKLTGVGPKLAIKLEKLGLLQIQDLLFHLPYRYQDRTQLSLISRCRQGEQCVIEGEIVSANIRFGKKRSLLCELTDKSGFITLRFFHFTKAQQLRLQPGIRLRCFGEVKRLGKNLEMIHPEYQSVETTESPELKKTLTPIYSTTEGIPQRIIQKLTDQAITILNQANSFPDFLPETLTKQLRLPTLQTAINYVHRPPQDANLVLLSQGQHQAQQRLAFEELLAHHLSLQKLRDQQQRAKAPPFAPSQIILTKLINRLPFTLTKAQQRVYQEISNDLNQSVPMLRLVQGDVGSGKTVIAAISATQVIEHGFQVALMAPTEILAEQHYSNFLTWFEPLAIQVVCLTGKTKAKEKRDTTERITRGLASIIIGTHALFQESVTFAKLGLIIIDEQHRFGVHQRLALREKGNPAFGVPHQLIMTATPIPRTLAMSVYSDLDHSIIDELPPGRKPIKTAVISNDKRPEVITRIQQACLQKHQAYWVCTLIEESEMLQCQAAENTAKQLQSELTHLRVALIHGRLSANEKETIMQAFKAGQIDLLVATTVIEVGVDVPNASMMIIENAERLGLSQLHQLRGRVGRGYADSHCVLLYQNPLSIIARQRLQVMREFTNGFAIAEKDLEIRGPGEVLGTKQAGVINFRIANLSRDKNLLPKVHECAKQLHHQFPQTIDPLIDRWLSHNSLYGQV